MIKFRYISFLFTLVACMILWSCTDSDVVGGSGNPAAGNGRSEAILKLDFAVPDGEVRTRDALGNTGVASLWVGVYDITTGNRVGAAHFPNPSGGKVQLPVLYYDEHPTVAIVGVANYDQYDNIFRDWNGVTIQERLEAAETWNDFVNINVKCPTSDNEAPVPMENYNQIMMGLLTSQDAPRHFVSIDNSGAVNIQNVDPSYYAVTLTSGLYGSMIKEITGKKIYLQRLYSQVNINIKTGDQAEVSNVSFRRCNLPKTVYLAEHPTYTGETKNWGPWTQNTPNFADTQMTTGPNSSIVNAESYYSDDENSWQAGNRDNTYSFYHYENKHWGYRAGDDWKYNQREQLNDSKRFLAGLGEEYNSYASYFVIRMTILDKQLGRSAQVEYVIHEGNCNDANGNAVSNAGRDYCAFRNMVYNYNITINGIDQITYNVSSQNDHYDGNSGVIWQADIINYGSNFTIEGPALTKSGTYDNGQPIPQHQGIIMRFYVGRGPDVAPLDWIAGNNLSSEILDELKGMYWPAIDSNTKYEYNTSAEEITQLLSGNFSYEKRSWHGWAESSRDIGKMPADMRAWGGEYAFTFYSSYNTPQWNPEAYKMGIYWYDPMETSTLSGQDGDGCTYYSNKICHVMEWKPAQRQAEQLYLNGNLPKQTGLPNFVTQFVELNFSNVSFRTTSNANVNRSDYEIYVKVNNNIYSLDSSNKCYIPISVLGTSNNYSVYAVSLNSTEFLNSNESYAGNDAITFSSPSWDFDKYSWISDLSNGYDFGNLLLVDGKGNCKFQTRKFDNSTTDEYGVAMGGAGSLTQRYFQLKVYKSCKLTVSYWVNNGTNRKVMVSINNGNPVTDSVGSSNTSNYKRTFTTNINADGETDVKIYSTDGDVYFFEIYLSDYN